MLPQFGRGPHRSFLLHFWPRAAGGGGGGSGSSSSALAPGAACAGSGITVPTVTLSDPTNGNRFVTTSTTGVAGGGNRITATFSVAMNPASINAASFARANANGALLTSASVS